MNMKEAVREMFERDWKAYNPNDIEKPEIRFATHPISGEYVLQETRSAYTMWKAGYVSRMRGVNLGNT